MKIGILGAGQLAQLLAHSAYMLGMETLCFSETQDAPAARNSPLCIGSLHDQALLDQFAEQCDVVTLENENIDVQVMQALQCKVAVYPQLKAIEKAQDRWLEKQLFQELSIPTPGFFSVDSLEDLQRAVQKLGLPAVLKTRRLGYDGKGQAMLREPEDLVLAWQALGGVPLILEQYIPFEAEVSMIAARSVSGAVAFYPLHKNTHVAGILRMTESPYLNPSLQNQAEIQIQHIFSALDYVGVLVIEYFIYNNTLIANEMAPRVHNSGHGTIEGYQMSQFEMHLRAIVDLPLLTPQLQHPTWMYNFIGTMPHLEPDDYRDSHVYVYGKSPRPGRKLGHMTSFEHKSALYQLLQSGSP